MRVYATDYEDIDLEAIKAERLMQEFGISQGEQLLQSLEVLVGEASKNSLLWRYANLPGVRHTKEVDRVLGLPRRMWQELDAKTLALEMTEVLRTPTGTMSLRPTQAIALLEFGQFGGLIAPMRAGSGKTLVTLLGPYVVDAARPVLVLPAKLIKKTELEMIELSKHWRIAYWLHLISYESLGRVKQATWLEDLGADMLACDEVHKLKNPKAAVTRRVRRYVEKAKPKFMGLSGTVTKRSIQDYAQIAKWALGEGAPVPLTWSAVEEWGNCLDEKPRSHVRIPPGALTLFSDGKEDLDAVRDGFRRRVTETPGVVATYDKLVGCSLTINRTPALKHPQEIEKAFLLLRDKEVTPDGWPLIGGLDVARHAKELALGFYYRWNPRAPVPWINARRAWASFVRYVLANNRSAIDTDLQVAQFYALGRLENFRRSWCEKEERPLSFDPYQEWKDIKDTFKPNKESIWLSDYVIDYCAQWLLDPNEPNGIVWCEHIDFAKRLSAKTGVPYCGAGGETADGRMIESFAGAKVIASLASSVEGRNLQAWSRALVTCPMGLGATWEQLLARLHRDGQEEEEVIYDVLSLCFENERAFAQARLDAQYIAKTTGQDQRLCYGDVIWSNDKIFGPIWSNETGE